MNERELSEIEAIVYAKQILGRYKDFKHVYKFYLHSFPVRLPNPSPLKLCNPQLDEIIPIIEVEFHEYSVVTGDDEIKIHIGYCKELDTLVYYHKAYIRD